MCDIEKTRGFRACKIVFGVCLIVSIGLIVGGFFTPPHGVVDGSVITCVGELMGFAALALGYRVIELGYDLKISHGNTNVEINND